MLNIFKHDFLLKFKNIISKILQSITAFLTFSLKHNKLFNYIYSIFY